MKACAELFIALLEQRNLHFATREYDDGDVGVQFPYKGMQTTLIFRGDRGEYVKLMTVVENVPAEKVQDVIVLCNELNKTYRFLKFFVDNDNDLMADADAILDEATAAEESFELLVRNTQILEDAKPTIMKMIYG